MLSRMIAEARCGSVDSLNQLLKQMEHPLRIMAELENSPLLRPKVGDSDLVQESLLDASRSFRSFQGTTADELTAWMRQILLNNLSHHRRSYLGTEKRDVLREEPWPHMDSDSGTGSVIAGNLSEPHAEVSATEEYQRVHAALSRLPEDFQQVLRWRFQNGHTVAQIADSLKRSLSSTKKLLARAAQQFDRELNRDGQPT